MLRSNISLLRRSKRSVEKISITERPCSVRSKGSVEVLVPSEVNFELVLYEYEMLFPKNPAVDISPLQPESVSQRHYVKLYCALCVYCGARVSELETPRDSSTACLKFFQ